MKYRPIFTKPAGESSRTWNNMSLCTTGQVTCELCGTEHPERYSDDGSYVLGRFLGMQYVEQCCGKAIDNVYVELGEEYAMAFLEDFADDPSDARFSFLRFCLPDRLTKAFLKLAEVSAEIVKAQSALEIK